MTDYYDRPSMLDTLVLMAEDLAQRGTCMRAQVGALAVRDDRVIETGYNGAPAGMPHCRHPKEEWGAGYASSPQAKAYAAELLTCQIAIHAEANLICHAAKHGSSLIGTTIITTLSPCVACARMLIQCGISKVVAVHMYRDPAGIELLRDATIDVVTP